MEWTCVQCGGRAVVEYEGNLRFCLDCNLKYQQSQEIILDRLEREHNRIMDDFDMVSGIPSVGGRYPERKKVVMAGNFTSIRIDGSNVGVVNTGSIDSVKVSLAGIEQGGNPVLATALKEMTEAVINSGELQSAQKNDAVQMLEMVAAEAVRPKEQRRSSSMRAVLSAFAEVVKVGAALAALWAKLGPTITAASSKSKGGQPIKPDELSAWKRVWNHELRRLLVATRARHLRCESAAVAAHRCPVDAERPTAQARGVRGAVVVRVAAEVKARPGVGVAVSFRRRLETPR